MEEVVCNWQPVNKIEGYERNGLKEMINAFIKILLTTAFVFWDSSGCTCKHQENLAYAIENADVIFLGEVIEINTKECGSVNNTFDCTKGTATVTFKIQKEFYGKLSKPEIVTDLVSGSCAIFPFEKNKRYLVYSFESDSIYKTSFCLNTTQNPCGEELKYLNNRLYKKGLTFPSDSNLILLNVFDNHYSLKDLLYDNENLKITVNDIFRRMDRKIYIGIKRHYSSENNLKIEDSIVKIYKMKCTEKVRDKIDKIANSKIPNIILSQYSGDEKIEYIKKNNERKNEEIEWLQSEINEITNTELVKDELEDILFRKHVFKKYGGRVAFTQYGNLPVDGFTILFNRYVQDGSISFYSVQLSNNYKYRFIYSNKLIANNTINIFEFGEIDCMNPL